MDFRRRGGAHMKSKLATVLIGGVLGVSGAALAQQSSDLGKYEYYSKCAVCHGTSGKGDGPMRAQLVKPPSDLTTYAKRNGGAFPTQLAWDVIDGRPTAIGAHGTREMPVWGQELRREAFRPPDRLPPGAPSPEWYVAGRISALIDYLASIQVK